MDGLRSSVGSEAGPTCRVPVWSAASVYAPSGSAGVRNSVTTAVMGPLHAPRMMHTRPPGPEWSLAVPAEAVSVGGAAVW